MTDTLPTPPCDILILGAGAAGLMAALEASAPGRNGPAPRVTVADAAPVAGRKMRLAGGGMGNLTNLQAGPAWYVGEDPAFVRPALRRFPPRAALGLFERYGLRWEQRDFDQIFGLQPMARLVEAMVADARSRGVRLCFGLRARSASRTADGLFDVTFESGGRSVSLTARRLILALGSPAWPSCGATDSGLALARGFGHRCLPFRPVLAPLVLPDRHPLRGLQGISVNVGIAAGTQRLVRPLLFTHRGISGPAGLIASCFWRPGQAVCVDFLPDSPLRNMLDTPACARLTAHGLLRRLLTARLADALDALLRQAFAGSGTPAPPSGAQLAQWNRAQRALLCETVHAQRLTPTGTEGMARAEAAAGGVRTGDVDARTLESRLTPGLYLAGELLDVTGLLGGFNLHWALASGQAAGLAARRSLTPDRTAR